VPSCEATCVCIPAAPKVSTVLHDALCRLCPKKLTLKPTRCLPQLKRHIDALCETFSHRQHAQARLTIDLVCKCAKEPATNEEQVRRPWQYPIEQNYATVGIYRVKVRPRRLPTRTSTDWRQDNCSSSKPRKAHREQITR
jgi:hypothetical protein